MWSNKNLVRIFYVSDVTEDLDCLDKPVNKRYKMEKGRRKSSASEFFSRRHSSSLFQSMRRYSTSTVFGLPRLSGASEGKSNGRRHSSSQLPISTNDSPDSPGSSRDFTRTEKWKTLAKVVLGDVEEQQEVDQNYDGDPAPGTGWYYIGSEVW